MVFLVHAIDKLSGTLSFRAYLMVELFLGIYELFIHDFQLHSGLHYLDLSFTLRQIKQINDFYLWEKTVTANV